MLNMFAAHLNCSKVHGYNRGFQPNFSDNFFFTLFTPRVIKPFQNGIYSSWKESAIKEQIFPF